MRSICYSGPASSGLTMDVELNATASQDDYLAADPGIIARTSRKRGKCVPWSDVVHLLGKALKISPEMRADLRVMLDQIESGKG